nr:FAD-dependent oxidoreductase [Clostridia bacterium]
DPWYDRLFPPACRMETGLAHPDRLKRHGEALCSHAGIKLLYAVQALQWQDGRLLVAHKSGLYTVECERIFDCRMPKSEETARFFALHVLDAPDPLPSPFAMPLDASEGSLHIPGGARLFLGPGAAGKGHAVLYVPLHGRADETGPEGRHAVYKLALEAFRALRQRPGCEHVQLARSGVDCLKQPGLDAESRIHRGLATPEGWVAVPGGHMLPTLRHDNPLYPDRFEQSFLLGAAHVWQDDVVVVGGGTAGAVAAYSAARQGLRVRLLEMNEMLGGTATCGGVSTYWFGTRDGATAEIDARVDALYRWLGISRSRSRWSEHDAFLPDLKAHALLEMCLEVGVEVVFGATAFAAVMEGGRVAGVACALDGRIALAQAGMVIDATGDADIAMFAGARHTYGGADNALTYWGSLAQYTSPGRYQNNFSTMVHVGDPLDYTRFIVAGRQRGGSLYDHGRYVALRESRHISGLQTVRLDTLLSGCQPDDTLYQCFSNYDPKGKLTADVVYVGLLPPNLRMNVPLGAVIPTDASGAPMEGLLVGGKAIGCTHDALPGLRMQPDLQQQGFALGVLAALALRQGVPAWQAQGVQAILRTQGAQAVEPAAAAPLSLRNAVAALTGEETLEWLGMDAAQWMRTRQPAIVCFLADAQAAVPLLREAFAREGNTPARLLLLARLLLWHGCEDGVPVLLDAVEVLLQESDGLPPRKGPVTFGQLLPDHGLMPEAVYLLNTLAWGKKVQVTGVFEKVLARLTECRRDWEDLRAGIYCYVECFPYVAMRRGERAFLPMLHTLLSLPELSDNSGAGDLLAERHAMLRLTLAEAVARLGDPEGRRVLRDLQGYPARAIRQSAEMLLASLARTQGIQPVSRRIL